MGFLRIGTIIPLWNISGIIADDIMIEYTSAKMSANLGDMACIRCSEVMQSIPGEVPFFSFFFFYSF